MSRLLMLLISGFATKTKLAAKHRISDSIRGERSWDGGSNAGTLLEGVVEPTIKSAIKFIGLVALSANDAAILAYVPITQEAEP